MQRYITAVIAVAFTGAIAGPALAMEYKAKGSVQYKIVSSVPVGGEKSGKVRLQNQGVVQHEGEASPIKGNTQTCTGIYTVDAEGAATSGSGYCDAVDADGDVWALHFSGEAGAGTWTISWGTGKFEGMTGGGTTKTLPAPGENMTAIEWEGSWTMK